MMSLAARHWSSLVVLCLLSHSAFADLPRGEFSMEMSAAQRLHVERANAWMARFDESRGDRESVTVTRPYAEYERARYLLISANSGWDSPGITTSIARNLPSGMTLVVLAADSSDQETAQSNYGRYLSGSRLKVLNIGRKPGLWMRDSAPVPVWTKESGLALVDAKYVHGNEPDSMLAQAFRTPLLSHGYYFEGGNLMNDNEGNCFVIGKAQTNSISDDTFRRYYGCQTLERLPYVAGIGHVDERVKVLSGKRIVTDESTYVSRLRSAGYDVTMLPRPNTSFGTYANALLVNGTVFLPVYRESTDREAQKIYEDLGYRVIPVTSSQLSSGGKGSVHCITMVYPEVNENDLIAAFQR